MSKHPVELADLSAYYDDALEEDDRRRVEDHLASCPSCRERLRDYAWVGAALRSIPDPPIPLAVDLRVRALLREESQPRRRWTLPPLWIPRPAVAAVVLAALLVVGLLSGLPIGIGGSGPLVASAYLYDDQGSPAIEVKFDSAVDKDSVAKSVQIEPAVEVNVSWRGDSTMVVKPAAELQPAEKYTLTLKPKGAESAATPVALQFAAQLPATPVVLATQAPQRQPIAVPNSSTASPVATAKPPTTATPAGSTTPGTATATASKREGNATPPATPAGTPAPGLPAGTPGTGTPTPTSGTATPVAGTTTPIAGTTTPTATATSTPPTTTPTPLTTATASSTTTPTSSISGTPTPTASPVSTPTATPTAPSGTPSAATTATTMPEASVTPTATPTSTATAVPTATPEPTATPTAAPILGVEMIFQENPAIVQALGATRAAALPIQIARQTFERGTMLSRSDTREVFILLRDGSWYLYRDSWQLGEPLDESGAMPPGLLAPIQGFGKLWRQQAELRQYIGWATASEQSLPGLVQEFDGGRVLETADHVIYILYLDGSWQSLPDPSPTPTAVVTPATP